MLLHSKDDRGKSTALPPPPSFSASRPRLSANATTLSRSHRIVVSTVLTAEPSVSSANRKRPLRNDPFPDATNVQSKKVCIYAPFRKIWIVPV